ncbi:hypothetical protein FQZ97_875190 [compost metagenome]
MPTASKACRPDLIPVRCHRAALELTPSPLSIESIRQDTGTVVRIASPGEISVLHTVQQRHEAYGVENLAPEAILLTHDQHQLLHFATAHRNHQTSTRSQLIH